MQYEKHVTAQDKVMLGARRKIRWFAFYSIILMCFAISIRTNIVPDYTAILTLQTDSISTDSHIYVYAKEKTIKVDSFDERLSLQDFNNKYDISGIAEGYPKFNEILFIVYIICAGLSIIVTIVCSLIYIRKKHNLY